MTPQQWVEWMNTLPPNKLNEQLNILTTEQTEFSGDLIAVWYQKVWEWESEQTNNKIAGNNEIIQGQNEQIAGQNEQIAGQIIIIEDNLAYGKYLDKQVTAKIKELVNLKIEFEKLGEQIDSNEILGHLKELVTSTSINEVWQDYKDWLISKGFTKQDLEQN